MRLHLSSQPPKPALKRNDSPDAPPWKERGDEHDFDGEFKGSVLLSARDSGLQDLS